jgi:hypothetical protein
MDSASAEPTGMRARFEDLSLPALISSALNDIEQIRLGARHHSIRQQAEACGLKLVHAFIAASRMEKPPEMHPDQRT